MLFLPRSDRVRSAPIRMVVLSANESCLLDFEATHHEKPHPLGSPRFLRTAADSDLLDSVSHEHVEASCIIPYVA